MENQSTRPTLSPQFLIRSLELNVPAVPKADTPFTLVTSDSRKVTPGSLFVALTGDNHDGHSFIPEVIERGARGVLCRKGYPASSTKDTTLYHVEDTLLAYRKLASSWRREFSIPVIAVAGSVGKTTTKDFIAAILTGKYSNVLKTQASQNGYAGIPMTLLELSAENDAAVIEIGIDEVGAMEKHIECVHPTASLITAIGPEHLEKLIDIPTVAKEEGIALTTVAKSGGMTVINLDDPWIKPHYATIRSGKKLGFTLGTANLEKKSGETIIRGQVIPDENRIEVQDSDEAVHRFPLPLPGKHNASNLLAAITTALGMDLTPREILVGLKSFKQPFARSDVQTIGDWTILCDYYNSQPASLAAALNLLVELSSKSPKSERWVCLGDMREMGNFEEKYHREIAPQIIQHKIEHVLLYGPLMKYLEEELKNLAFQGQVLHFSTHSELASKLTESLKKGDYLLIKGSRGMKMEEVWKKFESFAKQNK